MSFTMDTEEETISLQSCPPYEGILVSKCTRFIKDELLANLYCPHKNLYFIFERRKPLKVSLLHGRLGSAAAF